MLSFVIYFYHQPFIGEAGASISIFIHFMIYYRHLALSDQINLLKAGCTEILFIKANYTYDLKKRALTCGPDVVYTKASFLQGYSYD